MKSIFLIPLFYLYFAPSAFSQTSPCAICAQALEKGTKDEFRKQTSQSLDESINTLYSYDFEFWESYAGSTSKNMSLTAAYSVYSATFGSAASSAEKKEKFNRQKQAYQYSHTIKQSDVEDISQSLTSKIPYKAFVECMKTSCGNGIFVDYTTTGDDIVVTANYFVNSSPVPTKLTGVTVANATPIDFNFSRGTVLQPFNSISGVFKRINPKDKSIIALTFSGYPTQQIEVKRNAYQNLTSPVGTIVASVLEYPRFCSMNELPSDGPASELVWVPADGRSVSGSVYGRVQPNVPDLRGVFLRGVNIFDNNANPPYQYPDQKDSESGRGANTYRPDKAKAHSHKVNDPGHQHPIMVGTEGAGTPEVGIQYVWQGKIAITPDKLVQKTVTNITLDESEPKSLETQPKNVSVYYYIKIN